MLNFVFVVGVGKMAKVSKYNENQRNIR